MNGYFSVPFLWGLLLKYWLDCHIILVYDAILDWSNTQAYSQCITLLNNWWHIFFTIHVYNFIYDIHTMNVYVYSMTQRTLHKALCSFTAMRQSHTMVLVCPGQNVWRQFLLGWNLPILWPIIMIVHVISMNYEDWGHPYIVTINTIFTDVFWTKKW